MDNDRLVVTEAIIAAARKAIDDEFCGTLGTDFMEEALRPVVDEVRSTIFEVLRRHDVSEQCFAEIAMLTFARHRLTAYEQGRADERAAIVAYLRKEAGSVRDCGLAQTSAERLMLHEHASALEQSADTIEASAHMDMPSHMPS